MKSAAGLLLLLLLSACVTPSPPVTPKRNIAGFSCADPYTALQEIVCADAALAAQDLEMTMAFRRALRGLDLFGRSQLVADQRRWLLRRPGKCQLPERMAAGAGSPAQRACLADLYGERIAALAAWSPPPRPGAPARQPLAAYLEFRPADDREPALCAGLAQSFNGALRAFGAVDPGRIDGMTELAGSHGPEHAVSKGRSIDVALYDAGPYAGYQIRAKSLSLDGRPALDPASIAGWLATLPNSGGSFSTTTSSPTLDYAAIDGFAMGGRDFALVMESWGYYAAAARGEWVHAAVYELTTKAEPRCLYRIYLTPPRAALFDRLPAVKELGETLAAMAGPAPDELAPAERLDDSLLEQETQWQLLKMPLLAVEQMDRFQRGEAWRHRHDAALEAIFAWSERDLPSKQLYRRLLPLLRPAHDELLAAFRSAPELTAEQAATAADLLLMEMVDHAAESLLPDLEPANVLPRRAPAPAPGDLEKGRRFTTLHSAVLNHAPEAVVTHFISADKAALGTGWGRGPGGDSALMAAVRYPETLRQLLAAGADIEAGNDWHKTALMAAAEANQPDSVRILLAAGADPGRTTIRRSLPGAGGPDQQDAAIGGRSALLYAAAAAGEEVLQLLLERGADLARRDEIGHGVCDHLATNGLLSAAERARIDAKAGCPGGRP